MGTSRTGARLHDGFGTRPLLTRATYVAWWLLLSTVAPALAQPAAAIRIVPGGADDPVTAVRRFEPLTEHLTLELSRPVKLVLRETYREVLDAFGRDEIDVVFGNAINFVQARERYGARALVKRVTEHGTTYATVFVALVSGRAERLEDLRGRRIAFSDPSSTSGYVVPRLMLAKIGAPDPSTFFAEVKFKGNQHDAVRAVLSGEVDAASVASFILADAGVDARRLRVLARSDPMELGPVFVNPRTVPPEMQARLRTAFLAIGTRPATRSLASALQVRGFEPAADGDYRQIERLHQAVGRLPELPVRQAPEAAVQPVPEGEPVAPTPPWKLAIIAALALGLLGLVARRGVWDGLRGQFLRAFLLIILLLLVLVMATAYLTGQQVLRTGTRDSAVLLSQSVLLAGRRAVMTNDRGFLQQYADALIRQRAVPITWVAFHDDQGRRLAGSGQFELHTLREAGLELHGDTQVRTYRSGPLGRNYFQLTVPVIVERAMWGDVRLAFPLEQFHGRVRESLLNLFMLGLVAAVAGFGLADLLTRRIARPLRELVAGARAVSRGDLTWEPRVPARGEVGELATAFAGMTRSLQSRIDELIRAERLVLLGRLAAGIAHEVRNPLEAIKGAAHVIQGHSAADDETKKFTRIIKEEVDGLDRFLAQFLEFAGPAPLPLGPVAVNGPVEEVLALLGGVLTGGAVKVQAHLGDGLPPIRAESHQVKQVVLNLCLNAVQAMPGGGTLTVSTRPASLDDRAGVEVRVEDTGSGVSEEVRLQLFEPFITTKVGGTGLGLAVSRSVVERHHGRIWLAPDRGPGTAFCVWLPAEPDGAMGGPA